MIQAITWENRIEDKDLQQLCKSIFKRQPHKNINTAYEKKSDEVAKYVENKIESATDTLKALSSELQSAR